jgi:hypothetical protein
MNILREGNFEYLGKEVEPDDRKRLALATALPTKAERLRYRVFRNDQGQILLDPVKSVPAYQAWIYENPKIIQSIQAGIKSIEAGRTKRVKLPKNIV